MNHIEQLTVQHGGYIAANNISNIEIGHSDYSIGNQQQKRLLR